jgi:hypothetical protein
MLMKLLVKLLDAKLRTRQLTLPRNQLVKLKNRLRQTTKPLLSLRAKLLLKQLFPLRRKPKLPLPGKLRKPLSSAPLSQSRPENLLKQPQSKLLKQ